MIRSIRQSTPRSISSGLAFSIAILSAVGATAAPAFAQDLVSGQDIYISKGCYACHGRNGEGRTGVAPALDGNEHLESTLHTVSQVIIGRGAMPAFGHTLSNEEIASVVNYIRTAWGNEFEPVDAKRVEWMRQSPTVEEFPAYDSNVDTAAVLPGSPDGSMPEAEADKPDKDQKSGKAAKDKSADVDTLTGRGVPAGELVHVPVVTGLFPGVIPVAPNIKSPVKDRPEAVQRGMDYYNRFNCVGCHAPNGAGGMGPSLSNSVFKFGGEPENIYLSILQGRPNGMPAWGGMLPDHIIWDIVAYIQSISKEPSGEWGTTTSAGGYTIEQVPAEYLKTVNPWKYTTPFSYGQAPFEKPKGSPPLETPQE